METINAGEGLVKLGGVLRANVTLDEPKEKGNLLFFAGGQEILRLAPNGDIFVKGNLVVTDLEVVEGMRELVSRK